MSQLKQKRRYGFSQEQQMSLTSILTRSKYSLLQALVRKIEEDLVLPPYKVQKTNFQSTVYALKNSGPGDRAV